MPYIRYIQHMQYNTYICTSIENTHITQTYIDVHDIYIYIYTMYILHTYIRRNIEYTHI